MKLARASVKSTGEGQKDEQVLEYKPIFETESLGSPWDSTHSFLQPHCPYEYQKKLALRVKKLISL